MKFVLDLRFSIPVLLAAAAGFAAAAPAQARTIITDVDEAHNCRTDDEDKALITIKGLKDADGNLRVELYSDKEEDFIKNIIVRTEVKAPDGDATLCVPIPTPGKYSLSVLHDRNANGHLNVFSDGYGFANNPKLGWSKPEVEEATFLAKKGITKLQVILNYFHNGGASPISKEETKAHRPRGR